MSSSLSVRSRAMLGAAVAVLALAGCGKGGEPVAGAADAAQRVYVAPGQYDEFYAFMSGGFSGQLGVYGLPSGRLLKVHPGLLAEPENGYGLQRGDQADAEDLLRLRAVGRHAPSGALADRRRARRPLALHQRQQHAARGAHRPDRLRDRRDHRDPELGRATTRRRSSPRTPSTSVAATRFSVPDPAGRRRRSRRTRRTSRASLSFVKVDATTGRMAIAFQILMPGFDYDLAHAGKGPSHGWSFFTSYNSEQANTLLEVNASQNDKDFIAAVNWKQAEQCVAEGKAKHVPARVRPQRHGSETPRRDESEVIDAVTVLDADGLPRRGLLPADAQVAARRRRRPDAASSSSAGGKLATVIPVHSFTKMHEGHRGQGVRRRGRRHSGAQVRRRSSPARCKEPGPRPAAHRVRRQGQRLHLDVPLVRDREVEARATCTVLDRIPTYYSIGHLMIPGGDTRKPYGKYVVALNKITKDRYLPTGPELTQSAQLIDIIGRQDEAAARLPDHRRAALRAGDPGRADQGQAGQDLRPRGQQRDPYAARSEKDAQVAREGQRRCTSR